MPLADLIILSLRHEYMDRRSTFTFPWAWINKSFEAIHAQSVRSLGLRNAIDLEIFQHARSNQVVIMTKDVDFLKLIEKYKTPPQVILITCGNTSNAVMRNILNQHLLTAIDLLRLGEAVVEISGKA